MVWWTSSDLRYGRFVVSSRNVSGQARCGSHVAWLLYSIHPKININKLIKHGDSKVLPSLKYRADRNMWREPESIKLSDRLSSGDGGHYTGSSRAVTAFRSSRAAGVLALANRPWVVSNYESWDIFQIWSSDTGGPTKIIYTQAKHRVKSISPNIRGTGKTFLRILLPAQVMRYKGRFTTNNSA